VPPPLALIADQSHYVVTCVSHILNLKLKVSPRRQPLSPSMCEPLVAVIDAKEITGGGIVLPHDVGVVEVECTLVVAGAEIPPASLGTISTFACDIAYSARPTDWRASA